MTGEMHFSTVSMITLGVADLGRSRAFYEALGFTAGPGSGEQIVFFQLRGLVLALYPRALLAEDAEVESDGEGFDGMTLAHNYPSEEAVDAAMAHALASGATLKKKPQKVFWGGYSGYFADPDGHLWEVAHNPFVKVDDHGIVTL